MKNPTRYPAAALLLAVMLAFARCEIAAQELPRQDSLPVVRVNGEAVINAQPDQAQIDVGVVTQAQTAQSAAAQNATRLDEVLSELRRALGAEADLKTISYSLTPNYRYPKEGGAPTITGYTASNVVQVRLNDLKQTGKVIDLATRSGANQIQRLSFTLRDEQTVRAQALREATTRARAKAETLASALNLKVRRVLLVQENSTGGVRPLMYEAAMARADSAPTPVEPGTIEVRASVSLTVEIGQ